MSDDESSYRPLNAQETASMANMLASLRNIAEAIGAPISTQGAKSDIAALEEVLDHLDWSQHGETPFTAVGLAFGKVLVASAPLDWIKFKDNWGEEISLKLRGYEYFIHPASMIIKRVERGEEIDLQYLLDELLRRIDEDGPRQMPTPN